MLGPPLSGGVQLKQANTHPRRTLHERATMKDEVRLNNQMSELKSSQLGEPEGILHTPDLGLLKLTPPDLERLFIQSSAQQPPHFLYYPKAASDEQEFAEGFVKALEDLHQQNQLSEAGRVSVERLLASPGAGGPAGLHAADSPVYTTLNGYASSPLGAADSALPSAPPSGAQPRAAASRLQAARPVKDEPQTVPDMQSPGESPPLSPIDMDNQERIKAERKKLRNRIAASKCRKRKLERISRLEDKVKALKTQNIELASTASVLREQVAQLKQKVMNHVSSGCQLLPNEVQAY